ncbi:hypothetical protein U1Q18_042309 [Sarracenia purpurea var. burkii]
MRRTQRSSCSGRRFHYRPTSHSRVLRAAAEDDDHEQQQQEYSKKPSESELTASGQDLGASHKTAEENSNRVC